MQNVPMRCLTVILLVVINLNFPSAQGQATSPKSTSASPDYATVATAIRDSYYHPDAMSTLNCAVSVDWPAFFGSLKFNPPAERLKAIRGLTMRMQSVRGKSPIITFEWTSGAMDNKEQFEDGLKQMLGGFDQMYWSLVASPPINNAAEITKIEPMANGGAEVYSSSDNTKVVITVDRENVPTHYTLDSPAMNGTIDLRYTPAPKPVPGDVRRISSMDVSERIGTSIINVKVGLDYQTVDGFSVPGHVSYDLGGAYSLSMEFSNCFASKGAIADKSK